MVPMTNLAGVHAPISNVPAALTSMELPPALRPLRFGATQKPWHLMDGTSMRPGYRLTPQRLFDAYRQAELGAPLMQCDAFEDIYENDGHLRGQYDGRLASVAFRPWILQPGGPDALDVEAADVLGRALGRCNMLALFWHLMEALGYGYSAANAAWGFSATDDAIVPIWFLLAWQRRFLVSESGMGDLTFRTETNQWPGEELTIGDWIVATRPGRLVVRAGAFRTTGWWALFKRLSITDWIVFAEKFGIPITLGYYQERSSPESRAALLQAVQDVGEDGQIVLADTTKIVMESPLMRSGDVASLHPMIASRCDAEISKVITGATLNVEGGGPGSFALGKVHENRSDSLLRADALWLQDIFARQVIEPFITYNPRFAKAKRPRLFISVRPDMAPADAVKVYGKLQAMGLEIEDEQMYAEFGLRRPASGGVLKPLYVAQQPNSPNPTAEQ